MYEQPEPKAQYSTVKVVISEPKRQGIEPTSRTEEWDSTLKFDRYGKPSHLVMTHDGQTVTLDYKTKRVATQGLKKGVSYSIDAPYGHGVEIDKDGRKTVVSQEGVAVWGKRPPNYQLAEAADLNKFSRSISSSEGRKAALEQCRDMLAAQGITEASPEALQVSALYACKRQQGKETSVA